MASFTVDLADITEIGMRETGIFSFPTTRLVLHLKSGGTREIHPGMFSIGPVKFFGETAHATADRMRELGLSIDIPAELKYLV